AAALVAGVLAALPALVPARAAAATAPVPPRYDLEIVLEAEQHRVQVRQRVTWINPHDRPAAEVVFNVHSHYKVPEADVGFMAKMLEILRVQPGDALDLEGQAGN